MPHAREHDMDVHSTGAFSHLCKMCMRQGADTYWGGHSMDGPSVVGTLLICWRVNDIDIRVVVLADGRPLLDVWEDMDLGSQLELEGLGDPDDAVNVKADGDMARHNMVPLKIQPYELL